MRNLFCLLLLFASFKSSYGVDDFARKGAEYEQKGVLDSARYFYQKAIQNLQSPKDLAEIIRLKSAIGETYYTQSNFDQAIKTYYEVRNLINVKVSCKIRIRNELNIARTMYGVNERVESFELLKSLQADLNTCNDSILWSDFHYYIGVLSFEMDWHKEYKHHFNRALEYAYPLKNYKRISMINSILGEMYLFRENKPDVSKPLLLEALSTAKKTKDPNTMAFVYIKLAMYHQKMQAYEKAFLCLDSSYQLFESIGAKLDLAYVMSIKADIYREMGDAEKTFSEMRRIQSIKDTIYSNERSDAVSKYRTLFMTGQKEKENLELNMKNAEQRSRIWVLIAGFIVLISIILTIVFYRFQKVRHQHQLQKLNLQQERMKSMIEAEEKERIRIAKELHDGLGQVLSSARLHVGALEDRDDLNEKDNSIVKNALGLIDNAVVEVRQISHALMPSVLIEFGLVAAIQQLASSISASGSIKVEFDYDLEKTQFESTTEVTIFRVVQEVINNALKHANASQIKIKLEQKEKTLKLVISDNGAGFDTDIIQHSKGIGWKNITSRIQMAGGDLVVKSNVNSGTEVVIQIPLMSS